MQPFQIWIEGYAATGERGTASYEGTFEEENFDDAVELYLKDKEETTWPKIRDYYRKEERYGDRDESGTIPKIIVHSIWACRLFDNEKDARKSFG